uniref:Spherical body protein 2 truncated copy 5 n=1 Tax=Babesia bovis TaxID=5865 RepID=S6BGC7_BABBO|nr:spherical body protein 2 truncated copy 5 [Babesia bovis]
MPYPFFDQLLSELPADLAQEASKYSYLSEVPEDLANALEEYVKVLNDRIEEELDKIREAEMNEMLKEMDEKMKKERKEVVRVAPVSKPVSHKPVSAEQVYRVIRDYPPTKIGDKLDVEISSPFSRLSRGETLDVFSKADAIKNFRKIINHITGYCLKFKDQSPYGDIYTAFEDASTIKLPVDIASELASLPDDFHGLFPGAAVAPKTILYLGKLLTENTNGTRPLSGRSRAVWDKQYETNTEALYDAISVI